MSVQSKAPVSDIDLFSDAALLDPYELYRELRVLGPVVYLSRLDVYAVTQYAALREASTNWEVFSSARGVGMSEVFNEATEGLLICSDPPDHRSMRKVLQRPLLPNRLNEIAPFIREEAAAVVEKVVTKGQFDAIAELAQHLPLTIVSKLVGLGDYGRERMLEWAAASFDALGPMNERTMAALPKAQEMVGFALNEAKPGTIDPGGWAAALYTAAAKGEVAADKCPFLVVDYTAPSLDTTILATGSVIWLFAEHPDQWKLVRNDPSLIRHGINEALRLESPIQRFTRLVTRDHELDGVAIPSGSRVMLLYGSANRDETKYPRPESFDVKRKPSDHVAFGTGEHACAGMNLARLEIQSLLESLVPRVERFELIGAERTFSNVLRGFSKLEVRTISEAS